VAVVMAGVVSLLLSQSGVDKVVIRVMVVVVVSLLQLREGFSSRMW